MAAVPQRGAALLHEHQPGAVHLRQLLIQAVRHHGELQGHQPATEAPAIPRLTEVQATTLRAAAALLPGRPQPRPRTVLITALVAHRVQVLPLMPSLVAAGLPTVQVVPALVLRRGEGPLRPLQHQQLGLTTRQLPLR